MSLTCLIAPLLQDITPIYQLDVTTWNILTTICLVDPEFYEPSEVDLLNGAEHFWHILKQGKLQLSKHLPVLQNTS